MAVLLLFLARRMKLCFHNFTLLKLKICYGVAVEAAGVLHQAGLISVMRSIPDSFEDAEAEMYRSGLLKRFQDLRCDDSS